jgi:heat shock protein HslJ
LNGIRITITSNNNTVKGVFMRPPKYLMLVTTLAMLVLSACAPIRPLPGGATTPMAAPMGAAAANPLAGTSWILTELDGQAPLADATVTLRFEADGSAGGSDGCNNYFTTYTVDGDAISFGVGGSTMMACPEPIMTQAAAYQTALASAAAFAVADGVLTLSNADGAPVAVFAAQSSELAGSAWDVTNYNNGREAVVGVLADTGLTVVFGDDGTIGGSAGCNNFRGGYTVDGNTIAIGPLATTRMMCPTPEGVMEQEAEFVAALESAATYRIDGNQLELRTADDALAVWMVRAEPEAAAASKAAVTGAVTYLVRTALPEDAVVTVSIHNKQLADAPPAMTLLGEQVIATEGSQVPIAYAVEYDPAAVQEGALYAIGARINDSAGTLLFVSTTVNPVITQGNPTENVEILVEPVQ